MALTKLFGLFFFGGGHGPSVGRNSSPIGGSGGRGSCTGIGGGVGARGGNVATITPAGKGATVDVGGGVGSTHTGGGSCQKLQSGHTHLHSFGMTKLPLDP